MLFLPFWLTELDITLAAIQRYIVLAESLNDGTASINMGSWMATTQRVALLTYSPARDCYMWESQGPIVPRDFIGRFIRAVSITLTKTPTYVCYYITENAFQAPYYLHRTLQVFSNSSFKFCNAWKSKVFFYLRCIMGNNKDCKIRVRLEFYWWPKAK